MKKKLLIPFLLCLYFSQAAAQKNNASVKPAIAIAPISYTRDIEPAQAKSLVNTIERTINQSKRFIVLDLGKFPAVQKILENQRKEGYINSDIVAKQGKAIGATEFLVGELSASPDGNGIDYNFQIIDVSTGATGVYETVSSVSKTLKTGTKLMDVFGKKVTTPEDQQDIKAYVALWGELNKNVEKQLNNIIAKYYPMTYRIHKIEKQEGNTIREILIVGGEKDGLKPKIPLDIVHETVEPDTDGKLLLRKVIIGTARVTEVQGQITLCSIDQKKGKDISEILTSPGNKVYLSSSSKGGKINIF